MRTVAFLGIVVFVTVPFDLDVDIPTGSPFDSIKIPKETPTGGRPGDTSTSGQEPRPPAKPGETVAEDPKKAPPPKPPSGLPGVGAPSTIDYQQHLGWKPKDDLVEWKDPMKPDVATGGSNRPEVGAAWKVDFYPPTVPNSLYVYAMTRYLMVMLHAPMVSERELTQFLIEMGYPAHYAATACKTEPRIKRMAESVLAAVGPMVKTPPPKPADEIRQKVIMDLISRYCYESDFGAWILNQPTEVTLPILLDIIKHHKHPFLVRNAVFILRCYNTPDVVPPLRDLLTRTGDKVIRNRALAALVRWQDEEIVGWLSKQVEGADVGFRNYAAWALGRIGSPAGIDALVSAARKNAGDGEFLWSAIPALAWVGENAVGEKKAKVEEVLVALSQSVAAIKDPQHWDAGSPMNTRVPDPPNVLSKILAQRVRFALARLGRPAEVKLTKAMTSSEVLLPNLDFYTETIGKLP